ncbi:16S rRNA (guanine(966)-N(2))-methyltransferase RsmD [Candidatus Berkiella aquae]|uniref:Ribosomal RNA small subunit methyltransferase D n=1 Tax=Candidatus Berkiella aquae TaxID=295108 RepID=A0A0Q9YFR9_9GAMM|nr:16S rRNA (guanine(966)-N(2))-methyltransferase RsmD [Candidatus Berkiella aquae]MCS5709840.1 16S rRNA (guanine(966)-N(2))-methyltransferase RsmD [Candidatus Berkiella aquae]
MRTKDQGTIRIIGGKWRGRQIKVLPHIGVRPTPSRVRETVFNWLIGHLIDAQCLDLFAGSGALGFEALSRGAKKVTFVDAQTPIVKNLNDTALRLEAHRECEIILSDGLRYLRHLPSNQQPLDIIFLDPPFATDLLSKCLSLLACHPLVSENTLLYIETDKPILPEKLPSGWQLLKQKVAGEVAYHLVQGANP